MADLVTEPGVYRDRLFALPSRPPVADPDWLFEPPAGLVNVVADAAMVAAGDQPARWATFVGTYRRPVWGYLDPTAPLDRFVVDAGVPYFEADVSETEGLVRHCLTAVEPGLLLANNGEIFDLRGPGTDLAERPARSRLGPGPVAGAILGAAAILAAAWLVAAGVRTVRRQRSRPAPTTAPTTARRWRRIAGSIATLTALLGLGTVALVAAMPGLVDSGFLGGLELSIALRVAALHLPLALAVPGACTVALVTSAWVGRWWSRARCGCGTQRSRSRRSRLSHSWLRGG